MPRYRTHGSLDDKHLLDGDRAFRRMVTRVSPNVLEPGEVSYSQNGRMGSDLKWRPRKGLNIASRGLFDDTEYIDYGDELSNLTSLDYENLSATSSTSDFGDLSAATLLLDYESLFLTVPVTFEDYGDLSTTTLTVDYEDLGAATSEETHGFLYQLITDNEIDWGTLSTIESTQDWGGLTIVPSGFFGSINYTKNNIDYIILASSSSAFYIQLSTGDSGSIAYPIGVTISSDVSFTKFLNKIIMFRGSSLIPLEWDGNFANDFTTVANGAYTQPTTYFAPNNTVIASGLATVTQTAHGLADNTVLTIIDVGATDIEQGISVQINYVDANTFTYRIEAADTTDTITYSKTQSVGGGYIHMPNASWGVYYQGRLIVPYESAGDDQFIFSDIFDSDTFDPIENEFQGGSGIGDKLVAFHPVLNDIGLVFNQNSIFLCRGISGSLRDVSLNEITRELGCIARRSIVNVGPNVIWLSYSGIHTLNITSEWNYLSTTVPLSDPVDSIIQDINWQYASNAIAVYSNNRYFIALPYNGSTYNNVILVYNFLNQGWESIDTFPDGIQISDLVLGEENGKEFVYLLDQNGSIYRTDNNGSGLDYYYKDNGLLGSGIVDGQMITRQYDFGSFDDKKYKRFNMQIETSIALPELDVTPIYLNPDSEGTTSSYTSGGINNSFTKRGRLGKRAYGCSLKLETAGVIIKALSVEAMVSGRATINRS